MELKDLGFALWHVGVNCENEQDAEAVADRFEQIFGFKKKVGSSSVFAGREVEVMKTPGFGRNGHIGIGTPDVETAVAYLEAQGIVFNKESAKYKDGRLLVIYLEEEIGGFAVHLVRNL